MSRQFALIAGLFLLSGSGALAGDETDPLAAARTHLQKGRYEEALEAYAELAAAKADEALVAIGESRALEALGRWKEATEGLEAATKAAPMNAALWARLAEVELQQGRYSDAETSAAKAIQFDPDQPLAHLVQADVFTETGRLKEANEEYRWLVRYYNRVQPTDAESLLLVARGAAQYARWNSVSQIFNFVVNTLCPDALSHEKESWQAYYMSGSLLLEKYNRAQGLPELKQALAINPRAAEVLIALGYAALAQHELEEAERFAEQALEVNPHHIAAHWLKADLKLVAGQISEALKQLQPALAVNPHDQQTLARVAACYLLIDGFPPGEQFEQLLSNLDRIDNVAIAEPGRFATLVVDLAKRNPRPGYFLATLAETLDGRRKYDLAERLYKQAITTMPQLSQPKTALGMLYMRTGKNDEAQEILDEAFAADPYHVRVSNMRKVLKVLDDYDTISTDHFVIRVDSKLDAVLGRYMAEHLEECYAELVEQFGFEPPHRTQFEIFNDAKGLSAHQWFSARMVGLPWIQTIGASTGVMVAMASPTSAKEPYNWAKVVKHEFVHVLTLQLTEFNIPHWFTEALAVRSEGYPRPASWNKLLVERVPKGELWDLDNLNEGFLRPKSPLDWQFAYCQSRLYADYIEEEYGMEGLRKLLDAYRRNLATAAAVREVFGVEQAAFEKGYREYLDRIVAELKTTQGEPEKSLAESEKSYLEDKSNPQAAAAYAWGLLHAGQGKQAREVAEQAAEVNPAEPLAAVVLAELALRAEDREGAWSHLEPALDREDPHPRVLELAAKVKVARGKHSEAAELYRLGHETFPDDLEWLRGMATSALKLGQIGRAKYALTALARADADDPYVRKKLAQLFLAEKNYGEVVKYATMTLHIDVLDAETHRLLAEGYRGQERFDRAVKEYAVALELKPGDTELELALAETHLAAGGKDEARGVLERLLTREPDNAAAKELLKAASGP